MLRTASLFVLLICAFSYLNRLFLKENGSFSPKFVIPNWERCPQIETSPLISPLFNQPFHYLTKGKQSFVFVSEDGQYVLKLLRLPRYVRRYSFKGHRESLNFFRKTLEGCRLAYEELSEETQVLYAHLQPTHCFQQPTTLIDRFGHIHSLDLNTLPFVVQRRGDPFFSQFDKRAIDATLALFCKLYAKNIVDHDAILEKNYGVYENTPFVIDIGQLAKAQTLPEEAGYLQTFTHSLGIKLQKDDPDLFLYYEKALRRNK